MNSIKLSKTMSYILRHEDGHDYYQAGDSIYLTNRVPPRYINKSPTNKSQS